MYNSSTEVASLERAKQLIRDGKPMDAQVMLKGILEANRTQAEAWFLSSFVINNPDKQIFMLEQALKYKPDYVAARTKLEKLRGKTTTQSQPLVSPQSASITPVPIVVSPAPYPAPPTAQVLPSLAERLEHANQKRLAGNYSDAIKAYDDTAQAFPDAHQAYNWRGLCYANLGMFDKALNDYTTAIDLNPKADYYDNRGAAYSNLGDNQHALTDFEAAIQQNPRDSYAFYCRGVSKDRLSNPIGAIADYDEAIRLKPDYLEAYNNRGLLRNSQGDPAGAIADFTRAFEIQPNNAKFYTFRADVRESQGDADGALADYNAALRLDPQHNSAYQGRAMVRYFGKHDLLGALTDFDRSLQGETNGALKTQVYQFKGMINSELNNDVQAIADYTEAIRCQPHSADAFVGRAKARKQDNELDQQIADFENALRLNPNHEEAKTLLYFSYTMRGLQSAQLHNDFITAKQYVRKSLDLAHELEDREKQRETEDLLRTLDEGDHQGGLQSQSGPGVGAFIMRYLPAYIWLSIALAELVIAGLYLASRSLGKTDQSLYSLLIIAVILALYKALRRGVRLKRESGSFTDNLALWVMQIAIASFVFPFTEVFFQIWFLIKARRAWNKGEELLTPQGKPMRCA